LDVLSAWAVRSEEQPLLDWKKKCIKAFTGVPHKVYNSVPEVLYLKPFRTTGCTDRDYTMNYS
jgi:hypothetical protein